jgi:hypothetical protein
MLVENGSPFEIKTAVAGAETNESATLNILK